MTPFRLFSFCLAAFSFAIEAVKAEPTEEPKTSVQIVNATSVPAINLVINDSVRYPNFRQGLFTDGEATPMLSQRYEVTDGETGITVKSPPMKFEPDTHQALVIMGDFSTTSPPDAAQSRPDSKNAPNLLFRIYPFESAPDKWLQLRVINAMTGKKLIFRSTTGETHLEPGVDTVLDSQVSGGFFEGEVDGKKLPISIMPTQRVNAMVIFYLKKGEPAAVRIFDYDQSPPTTE